MSGQGVGLESALGYSDGTKYSRATPCRACRVAVLDYGLANPTAALPGDVRPPRRPGVCTTTSVTRTPTGSRTTRGGTRPRPRELVGRLLEQEAVQVEPWKQKPTATASPQQRPGEYDQRPFADLDLADSDVDGDDAARRRGRPGQRRLQQHHASCTRSIYDLDGNGAGGVNPPWCGEADGPDPVGRPRRPGLGGQRVQPVRAGPDVPHLPAVHPLPKQFPPRQFLLQPGARTLVCRVWAPCLCGS